MAIRLADQLGLPEEERTTAASLAVLAIVSCGDVDDVVLRGDSGATVRLKQGAEFAHAPDRGDHTPVLIVRVTPALDGSDADSVYG